MTTYHFFPTAAQQGSVFNAINLINILINIYQPISIYLRKKRRNKDEKERMKEKGKKYERKMVMIWEGSNEKFF